MSGKSNIAVLNDNSYIRIGQIVSSLGRYLPWRSKCYEQAIAVKQMLNNRKISNDLCLGVKHENGEKLFHAWILVRNNLVVGGRHSYSYNEIARFASEFK